MHYIFFLLFFGGVLLATSDRRTSLGVAVIFYSAFVLFAIVFADGSWDYRGYKELYDCAVIADCRGTKNLENTFWIWSRAARSLFGEELGFVVLLAGYIFPAFALKLWILFRRAPNFAFALFAYACWFFFLMELTQIRAALAVGIVWLAVYLRATGSGGAAAAALLVAVAFHNSAAAAAPLLFLDKFVLNARWQAIGLAACIVTGQVLAFVLTRTPLDQFAGAGRLGLYLSVAGRSVMDVKLLNVSFVVVLSVYLWRLIQIRRTDCDLFEALAVKGVWLGLCLYALAYWIPGAGLRVFEFLAAFTPIIASGVYRDSRFVGRAMISMVFCAVFLNLVVRNGLRTDFVLPWHPEELREAAGAPQ